MFINRNIQFYYVFFNPREIYRQIFMIFLETIVTNSPKN